MDQTKALESWYVEDHPLRLEPLHPLLGLAGEAGELLNLYKKNGYKPTFDKSKFREMLLDELGDFWYYLRIIMWQQNLTFPLENVTINYELLMCLSKMNCLASNLLDSYIEYGKVSSFSVRVIFSWIIHLLYNLNFSLDELTELNYKKLNSEPTQHGWSSARRIK